MVDKKISELAVATTPLAGTELSEIVQGGINKQVPVSKFVVLPAPLLIETVSAGTLTSSAPSGTIDFATLAAQGYQHLIIRLNSVTAISLVTISFAASDDDGVSYDLSGDGLTIMADAPGQVLVKYDPASSVIAEMEAAAVLEGTISIQNFASATVGFPKQTMIAARATAGIIIPQGIGAGSFPTALGAINKFELRTNGAALSGGSYTIFATP